MRAVTMTKLQSMKSNCSREWICENKKIIKEKGGKHCSLFKKQKRIPSGKQKRKQMAIIKVTSNRYA